MSGAGDFWVRWRVRLGYPVAAIFLLLAHPSNASLILGGAIGAVGLFIRAAAAGHLRKHEELATSGPYSYTRNPLYLGSGVLAAGVVLAGGSWLVAPLVGAYFVLFYAAVIRREERELRSKYGGTFNDYAERVPLFFPRFRAGVDARWAFSWALYARNREYQALLGFVAGVALLWAKMQPLR